MTISRLIPPPSIKPVHLLLAALVFATLTAWGMPRFNEDLSMSLCLGRDILNGYVAAPDIWSFTLGNITYIDRSWLSNLLFYLTYSSLGNVGPLLIKGLLLISCQALLFFRSRALGASREVSIFSLIVGTVILGPFILLRAENFGMFWFVLLGYVLTTPMSRSRLRQFLSVAILAMWTNSHGTFLLGFCAIVLRFLIDFMFSLSLFQQYVFPAPDSSQIGEAKIQQASTEPCRDPLGWLTACLASIAVLALATPYGFENLALPFGKLDAIQKVIPWQDYIPLLHFPSLYQDRFIRVIGTILFVGCEAFVLVVPFILLISRGFSYSRDTLLRGQDHSTFFIEVGLLLMMLPLVLKWRRLMILACPAMIPILALMIQICLDRVFHTNSRREGERRNILGPTVAFTSSISLVVVIAVMFYETTILVYLPGNPVSPTVPERPLIDRLAHFPFAADKAIQFMKTNRISGRVLVNHELANHLLLKVPNIKVFFDLRAHVVYPYKILKSYVGIMYGKMHDLPRITRDLNRHGVEIIVLDTMTQPHTRDLAHALMRSRQWGCIYKDDWIFILARAESKRFGPIIRSADLLTLNYLDKETRIISQAVLQAFTKGKLPNETVEDLLTILRKHPTPDVFSLALLGMNHDQKCLNAVSKRFLHSNLESLATASYLVTGGVHSILGSIDRILIILEANERTCGTQAKAQMYAGKREELVRLMERASRRYSGF